ncbi:MAG: class I SAM-dependent rRNA methyltransferase, partial [Acidobacteria bacterium]|nr:class I SAM-dependent rRNA methyltransferase [Acidobacteriota bacterium]
RADVVEAKAASGDTVLVRGPGARPVGRALYSGKSQIALRMLTRSDEPADLGLWKARLAAAVRFRDSLAIDADAYRLVHGEGDLLPGLVVDRYTDVLVVQSLVPGVERLLSDLVVMLVELTGARGVLARDDVRVRALEGLDARVEVRAGDVPRELIVREGRIEYEVDVWTGQKTGLFLDQRENRQAARQYAHGRLLDAFSYHGGFALQLAACCERVEAIDVSEEAVARIEVNARRNRVTNLVARAGNVFDELRMMERAGERFDTIVLDPPAFAKNKSAVARALSGYKEINLRALKLLSAGGVLVTCSCSYNLDEATFGQIVYEASVDAGVQVSVVEKRTQSRDHPIVLGMPETYYLKCLILRKLH